jgi:hypothetical protein
MTSFYPIMNEQVVAKLMAANCTTINGNNIKLPLKPPGTPIYPAGKEPNTGINSESPDDKASSSSDEDFESDPNNSSTTLTMKK